MALTKNLLVQPTSLVQQPYSARHDTQLVTRAQYSSPQTPLGNIIVTTAGVPVVTTGGAQVVPMGG
jgi:hypothetical protein